MRSFWFTVWWWLQLCLENQSLSQGIVEAFVLPQQRRTSSSGSVALAAASSSTTTASNNNIDPSTSPPPCPFSRTFPRYRIDLTTPAVPDPTMMNPFRAVTHGFVKARLEASLPRRPNNDDSRLVWKPKENGVAVVATLWRMAADLVQAAARADDSVTTATTHTITRLVVFPDASPRVVQQWCDIYHWWCQHQQPQPQPQTAATELGVPQLQVEYIQKPPLVPRVRMTLLRQPPTTTAPTDIPAKDDTTTTTTTTTAAAAGNNNQYYNHEIITNHTQAWVQRILVDQGICPFTKSTKKSGQGLADLGIPVGAIAYHTSTATDMISLQADCWHAIQNDIIMTSPPPTVVSQPPSPPPPPPQHPLYVSSILLAAPHWDDRWEEWAGPVWAMLEAGVVAARAGEQVGLVCFHPLYQTPDGSTWPGFGQMHSVPRLEMWMRQQEEEQQQVQVQAQATVETDRPTLQQQQQPLTTCQIAAGGAWQRRTPHATLNVLRADQLAVAERRRDSPQLYYRNICKLVGEPNGIGVDRLQHDLDKERSMV